MPEHAGELAQSSSHFWRLAILANFSYEAFPIFLPLFVRQHPFPTLKKSGVAANVEARREAKIMMLWVVKAMVP